MNRIKTYQSQYSQAVAVLTKRGMEQAAQEGRVVGTIPLGYVRDVRTKLIVQDYAKAKLIELAFKRAFEGRSLREICSELQTKGLTGRHGELINLSTLYRILNNPFYAGYIRYEGCLYPGQHEPLFPPIAFEKVQEKLKTRRDI